MGHRPCGGRGGAGPAGSSRVAGLRAPRRAGTARPRERRQLRAVVSGYYGFGNLGDEAVLAGVLTALREQLPSVEPVVLSSDPAQTRSLHGVQAAPRGLRSAWRVLDGAGLLVSGGGGLLQDVTSRLSPFYYLAILEMARWRGVPVVWWAQGVGPLRSRLARALVARAAAAAAAVVVRDRASQAQLVAWGVDPGRIERGADAAWLLPVPAGSDGPGARSSGDLHLAAGGEGGEPAGAAAPLREEALPAAEPLWQKPPLTVAVAWRDWPGQPVDAESAGRAAGEAAGRLSARWGRPVRLQVLALHPAMDDRPARRFAGQAQHAAPASVTVVVERLPEHPGAAAACLAASDAAVSVRLHGLLMAALAGVPVAAVAYDPKVEAFLREIRWPVPALAPRHLADPACWLDTLDALIGRQVELTAHLARERARMQARARRSARAFARALSRREAPGATGSDPSSARRTAGPLPDAVDVLGVPMHPVSLEQAAEIACRWAGGSGPMRWIVTLNPEMVMEALRDPEFRALLSRADLLVPDGVGTVWAGRMLGWPVPGRVPGIELAERSLAGVARAGLSVFLVGGRPGTAEEACARLSARLPGLIVAGCHHGYFEPGGAEEAALLRRIVSARPALLLVGMGSPRQERWLACHRRRLGGSVRLAMGVGGSLDVWAGRVPRAPVWMRRAGMEWAFRLLREPRRARRMLALPAFAGRVLLHVLGGRRGWRGPSARGIDAGR